MTKNRIHGDSGNSPGVGSVTEKLGSGIQCCELALSSGSARTWKHKIKNAQKAHDFALRFVHRFELSEHEARRVNQYHWHQPYKAALSDGDDGVAWLLVMQHAGAPICFLRAT